MTNTATMSRVTVFHTLKARTIATLFAIIAAVAVPELFHAVGAVSGLGAALGKTFLPMHLPILLVGLLAGPTAGLVAGCLGPIVSFALSGMPTAAVLPFMGVELAVYGLAAGLLATSKLPMLGKVVLAQVAGRMVRALVTLFAFHVLGNQTASVVAIWGAVVVGLPGLLLQWSLIPLLMFWVENRERKHD